MLTGQVKICTTGPRKISLALIPVMVPKSRLVTKGDCAFAICAPKLWNSLPGDIRHATTVSSFKSLLKTHFYCMAFY